MEIQDYNYKCREYVISQLRNIIGFKEILEAISNQYLELQDKVQLILNYDNIDDASGDILDYKGYLYGITRQYFDISQYFKVNSLDVNTNKYFFFENPTSEGIVPYGSLSDILFRQRIKAKIGSFFSRYTRNDNIYIIKNMTFSDNVIITKENAMLLNVHLTGANVLLTDTTRKEIEGILGDGVGLNDLTIN